MNQPQPQGGNDPQAPEPKLVDSSAPLFSMYNKKAKEHDEKMTEGWKGDAEGILVFTGLFSAVVAQFLGSSLQNLQSNPQNASSFYLARIYQLTPGSNASSIPLPDDPATFKPPTSAILVSTLWSFSLVISLTCALLATLLQRWARRYMHITLECDDPQERAQTRELMSRALKKQVHLRWMVEFLPFLLHTSVFLFVVGFVVYLFAFNSLVAKWVAGCAGTSLFLYLYISFVPMYSCDSPYSTPLTTLFWFITNGSASLFIHLHHSALLRHLQKVERRQLLTGLPALLRQRLDGQAQGLKKRLRDLEVSYEFHNQLMRKGIKKGVEKLATTPSGLATFVLSSTFDFLDGVSDLEQFLSYIPGFYDSASAQEHFQVNGATSDDFNSNRLPSKISFFMRHVLSSNVLKPDEKTNHITMCSKAIKADASILRSTFKLTLQTPDSEIFDYADFVKLALEHKDDADDWTKSYARCIMAIAINRAQNADTDVTWKDIARRYFVDEDDQDLQNVNNLRLCNLIYLTQHLKDPRLLATSDQFAAGKLWHNVLAKAQNVGVAGIAPGLQKRFIALRKELQDVASRASSTNQERQNATYVRALLDTFNAKLPANP